MIKTHSLRIDYEGVTAVRDLDLEVKQGQIYGLVGPNGAGKTSTLKALAGILEPTYGDIVIGGFDLETHPREALALCGFMPDFPPVYEHLTVWEYLDVFAAAYGIEKNKRLALANRWIERVKLGEKTNAYIHTLSRGMRQRLILAKTLLHDPLVVLLDEPASGLDPIARMEMRNILKEIASSGKTIVISSHILTELSDFCNAVGIMEKGRLVASGSIEEIRAQSGMKGVIFLELAQATEEMLKKLIDDLSQRNVLNNIKQTRPGVLSADFSGDKTAAAALLGELIRSGFALSQFYLKEADMEDIFFKIGARETS